ncbi:MAG: hypothetical protein VB099_10680 [Candidatus Limiplasma sp.]|nr:hypothetical protein [Candidatus Limiplasma sp.]
MATNTKKHTIEVQGFRLHGENPAPKSYTGALAELTEIFSYTLKCGNSWDRRVSCQPKTIASLVSNLNRAAAASSTHYQNKFYTLRAYPA